MQPPAPKHLARRGGRTGRARNPDFVLHALIGVAVVLVMALAAANLPERSGSSAPPEEQVPDQSVATTTRPPARAQFGNLVENWSFEEDLAGWKVFGAATASREPPGRTSGSCALVRATGSRPGRVGLGLPGAVRAAPKGSRFVASAWVRSNAPGLQVTARLVGAGGTAESSKAGTTTLPGLAWRRVIVGHTVTAAGATLDLQVTADGVAAGDVLLVDEVIVRQG
jgi:hypothetical protein